MRREENNYIIYKAENLETGYVYIGATTRSLHERRIDHLERAQRGETNKFQEAISTYGSESFKWEQVDTANSVDELAQKEKEYIVEYNTKEDGYNSDSGGGFKKTVYQYNLENGMLIKKYSCLESAGYVVNATKQQLSRACLSRNKTFEGFYWSYEYKEPFIPTADSRKKKVLCFNQKDDTIIKFDSVAEASKVTGCNKSSIAKVCRGERNHAGGFIWQYE